MPTFGFLIDNRKCIGCHACTVACKSEHQVPLGVDRTWVKYVEKGTFPHNRRLFTVMRCNHCEWAPCVAICPVTALYRRDDGVVDFNPQRCIGCKACMQACPYDALHIDPVSHTAAKCNFCTHRLEAGLEPSCVVVCPEQAIIAGDLDDPGSRLALLIERHPVQVRKPEKGTRPKLYYIEGDEAALVPSRTQTHGRFLWSRGDGDHPADGRAAIHGPSAGFPAVDEGPLPLDMLGSATAARRVYDVRPRPPAWGWQVAAYTWTKSLAAGALLAVVAARLLAGAEAAAAVAAPLGSVALVFLLATTALLIGDLKRPDRFLYILLRPQWGSWLVRGAYTLVAYGAVLTAWLASAALQLDLARWLLGPAAALAVLSAVYTAFLFAQAKGRDLWQSPLLCVHLLVHALLAGGAAWLVLAGFLPAADTALPRAVTAWMLAFSLVTLIGEILTAPPTEDARRAMDMIIGRPMGRWFWGGGVLVGHVLPLLLLVCGPAWMFAAAAVAVLAGLLVIERLWVLAPQRIPLS